jgi:transposase InsO family protein
MRIAGLAGRFKKRWRKTTVVDPDAEQALDLIQRHFGPCTEIDRRYVGDITYVATWEGWAYLGTVIDLASRRVVGWALADHMRTELVEDALSMAFSTRHPEKGVIFHSDRGCQYTSKDFAELARNNGVVLSVGRKGECWDKDVVSYCTSLCWLSQNSPAETAALPFDESGITGRRWVEEPGVAVIGLVTTEHAGSVPGLDGGRAHSEKKGDLGNGEFAGGAKSVAPARELAVAA